MKLRVLDFTARLPGPMAGAILADLGATVHRGKLKKEDPFQTSEDEPLFMAWAKNFEAKKEKVSISADEVNKIKTYDLVLCPPTKEFFDLSQKAPELSLVMIIGGEGSQKYLHDLNALFLTKTFLIHLKNSGASLPYLPIAGIIFAQQIALEAMSMRLENRRGIQEVYLDRSVKRVLDLLWADELESNDQMLFLHNGKYPCYNIYRTKDGAYVALAAVESRFWSDFAALLGLSLSLDDRFDTTGKTGQKLSKMFLKYTKEELLKIIGDRDICLNVL